MFSSVRDARRYPATIYAFNMCQMLLECIKNASGLRTHAAPVWMCTMTSDRSSLFLFLHQNDDNSSNFAGYTLISSHHRCIFGSVHSQLSSSFCLRSVFLFPSHWSPGSRIPPGNEADATTKDHTLRKIRVAQINWIWLIIQLVSIHINNSYNDDDEMEWHDRNHIARLGCVMAMAVAHENESCKPGVFFFFRATKTTLLQHYGIVFEIERTQPNSRTLLRCHIHSKHTGHSALWLGYPMRPAARARLASCALWWSTRPKIIILRILFIRW